MIKIVDATAALRRLFIGARLGNGDLQVAAAKFAPKSPHALWPQPLHIVTVFDSDGCLFGCSGAEAKGEHVEQSALRRSCPVRGR